jgi:hypothetical protein
MIGSYYSLTTVGVRSTKARREAGLLFAWVPIEGDMYVRAFRQSTLRARLDAT